MVLRLERQRLSRSRQLPVEDRLKFDPKFNVIDSAAGHTNQMVMMADE